MCGRKGARGKGAHIFVKGITGDTIDAERAAVIFPVTTTDGKHYDYDACLRGVTLRVTVVLRLRGMEPRLM